MRLLPSLLMIGLVATGCLAQAQEPNLEPLLDEGTLEEVLLIEEGVQTLLLDNSRSRIGREFYDAFFRHYAELPKTAGLPVPPDSAQVKNPGLELDLDANIVTIDELPAFGIGTTIISITLNDQLIWQNYVQSRADVIEAFARDAAEIIHQYVIPFREIQLQLEGEDQRGTGIF